MNSSSKILFFKYFRSDFEGILAVSIGTREQNSNKSGGSQEVKFPFNFSYKNLLRIQESQVISYIYKAEAIGDN